MVDVKSLQFLEVALLFTLTLRPYSKGIKNQNLNKSQILWLVITPAQNFARMRAYDRCEVAV